MEKYRRNDAAQQILLIKYEGGWDATSPFLVKDAQASNGWKLVFEDDSVVGQSGAGTARAYTRATPMGDFASLEAFGILSDPATALPYMRVTNTVYASCECSENCPYFNTNHDVSVNGRWECSGERIITCAPDGTSDLTIFDLAEGGVEIIMRPIRFGNHCYACTAGAGSSCGGTLVQGA